MYKLQVVAEIIAVTNKNVDDKGRIHWNFSFRVFHEIQFQGHFMNHEILSWNTFTLVSQCHCVCFSSMQKLCLERKDIFWQRKSNSINFDKQYLLLKTKTKKSKRPKCIEWNHGWNTGTTKKYVLAYFQNFGWLTNSSIIFAWILYHTIDHTVIFIYWLIFTFYITYTYNNTVCIDYFDASNSTRFSFYK